MSSFDPANPWSSNPFDMKVKDPESYKFRAPKVKTPRIIPGQDDLFAVQRDSLKVLNDLKALADELNSIVKGPEGKEAAKLLSRAQRNAEDTYRVIRSYLNKFAS